MSEDLVVVNSDDAEEFADESTNQALDVTTETPIVDSSPAVDEEADEESDDILWIAEDEAHEQLEDDDEYESECEADDEDHEDEYEDDDVENGWEEDEDEDYERDEAA
jgi:hypothetical protein